MADDGGEKKHDPGEKKWREAAEKGSLPKSPDLSSTAVVTVGFASLVFGSDRLGRSIHDVAVRYLQLDGPPAFDMASASSMAMDLTRTILGALALPMGAVLVAGVVVNLAQTRAQLATKALEINWSRLDAIGGIQKMYMSWMPLVELAKGVGKIGLLSIFIGLAMWPDIIELPRLAMASPSMLLAVMIDLAWKMVLAGLPVMLGIAVIDYAYSWWRTTEDLKRTDQEVRDDAKQAEGNPQVKGARRQRQMAIARGGGGLRAVKDATVIVTNPTHYAVALRYRRGEDAAPTVVAKGVDHLAMQIRMEAIRHGVPRIENRPLARALHATVALGQAIPEELYGAVAQVLAVVLRRRQGRA